MHSEGKKKQGDVIILLVLVPSLKYTTKMAMIKRQLTH
jgi:hypothetical protein